MATEIRLGIAGNSSTNFASSPIPSLTLSRVTSGGILSTRNAIGANLIAGRSNYGTLAIGGAAHGFKYAWEINAVITDAQNLILDALLQWQKDNPTTGLRLIDEVEYLEPATTQSRTLLATLSPSWNAELDYGFGVFSVALVTGENWRERFGRPSEGFWNITLGAEEL